MEMNVTVVFVKIIVSVEACGSEYTVSLSPCIRRMGQVMSGRRAWRESLSRRLIAA